MHRFGKKQNGRKRKNLKSDVEFLEKSGLYLSLSDLLEDKKEELEDMRQECIQGIVTRVKWLEEGEKPSSFFCSLEKQNFIEKTIKYLKLKDDKIITDQKKILGQVRK